MRTKKSNRRLFAFISLLFTVAIISFYFPLFHYGYLQFKGQVNVLMNTQTVAEIKPTLKPLVASKLELVEEILSFCNTELGLDTKGNYQSYYDHGNKPLMHLVTASHPFELKPYQWHFPLVGSFPYKGFFSKFYAELEVQQLKDEGYDVNLGKATAWSTLGIVKDPILSGMLKRSDAKLAELIIHEVTHSNIYYLDSSTFNENLADFIGKQGALQFMERKFSSDSQEARDYLLKNEDTETYRLKMNNICSELERFYEELKINSMSNEKKKEVKELRIKKLISEIDINDFNFPGNYKFLKRSRFKPNNAFFTSYNVYQSLQNEFMDVLNGQFSGDLPAFIQWHMEQSVN